MNSLLFTPAPDLHDIISISIEFFNTLLVMSGLEVWKELATTQLASKPLDKNACLYFQSKSNRVSLTIFSSQAKGTQVLQPL